MSEDFSNVNEQNEPSSGGAQMPMGIFIGLILLGYIGCYKVDQLNANFAANVHAPFSEPDEVASLAPSAQELLVARGKQIYAKNCVACHQANGAGSGTDIPPLAGSEWVKGDPATIVAIVQKGLIGPISVAGKNYGAGTMTPAGETLSADALAAVISFVRTEWGNGGDIISADVVNAARKSVNDSGQSGQWTVEGLKAAGFAIPE
ncbi:MAG: cytochrome c [Verrucomicrobia subdivision 3 bacterium]|nr:cytochrome c [Limisphaerales bacterium]